MAIEVTTSFPSSNPEYTVKIDGIELTPQFNFKDLRSSILVACFEDRCDCCSLREVYNGYLTGPLLFICPKGCSCHD